jgi:hypothetical protein
MASAFVGHRGLASQESQLTVLKAKAYVNQFVGGQLPAQVDVHDLLNETGQFFASMHPWKWLTDREMSIPLRGSVAVTGGTMGDSTADDHQYKITATDQLGDYWRVEGDVFEVTGGTNVTKGFYRVIPIDGEADDYFAVEDNPKISTSAVASAITGTLHTSSIPLPTDFRELIAIHPSSGTSSTIQLTTYEELLEKKSSNMAGFGGYWAAITHGMDFIGSGRPVANAYDTDTVQSTGAGPKPRLEIVPEPTANKIDAFKLYYRAGWSLMKHDDDKLRLPIYLESLYLEILRCFVTSRFGEGDLNMMLANIVNGPLFAVAMDRDGSIQPHYGPIRHGAAEHVSYTSGFQNYDSVAAPS